MKALSAAERKQVSDRLRAWGQKALDKAAHTHREAAFEVARNVVVGGPYSVGTPVDTGAARDSWTMVRQGELARPFVRDGPIRDNSGEAVLAQSLDVLNGSEWFATVALASSCPYMPRLERGWSQQAPAGMVRTTLRSWKQIVRDARKRVNQGNTFTAPPR